MAFWDSSALTLLCLQQPASSEARRIEREHPLKVVWWGSKVEIYGAICRAWRNGDVPDLAPAVARLGHLSRAWYEVPATDRVRDLAERALEEQPLRAADALQLAAALVWCRERPRQRPFVTFDARLGDAARRAGFTVLGV